MCCRISFHQASKTESKERKCGALINHPSGLPRSVDLGLTRNPTSMPLIAPPSTTLATSTHQILRISPYVFLLLRILLRIPTGHILLTGGSNTHCFGPADVFCVCRALFCSVNEPVYMFQPTDDNRVDYCIGSVPLRFRYFQHMAYKPYFC